MGKPSEQGLFMDSFASFEAGMNSDVPAIALPKNQAAFLTNATCRGNYFTHRPPYSQISLTFEGVVQDGFEQGLFQGAAYYKPDTGPESIITSISGRFYKITPAGGVATVQDITGDTANPSTSTMAWMWQGELFMFINDGISQTAIYNGVEMNRALGDELVATISSTWTVPAEGSSVAVTFSAAYDGPLNSPLYVYSGTALLGIYEVNEQSAASGYSARLTNVDATPGTLYPIGTEIQIVNNWSGTSQTTVRLRPRYITYNDGVNGDSGTAIINVTPPYTGPVGATLIWPSVSSEFPTATIAILTAVEAISNGGSTLRIRRTDPNGTNYPTIAAGNTASIYNASPDVLVATTTSAFNAPALGASVDVTVDTLIVYSGQQVQVDGNKYTLSATPASSTTMLYLKLIEAINNTTAIPANATVRTIPQLPPGLMGAYGLGRNWICLPDGQSYLASDIVGSSSGSIAYKFRDSILNVTENNYLAGGGVFRVPGAGQQIAAIRFPATLDSSLGQGPLQILTQNIVFSCNAPIQRSEWQNLTNPIQTQSLIGAGGISQDATIPVNGDLWFRSGDGIRSLKLARQDFQTFFGNTPQSVEMNRVLVEDDRSLLNFASEIVFDNRLLCTASPTPSSSGTYHTKLIALNLDPNSSLRVKQPPIYDGEWNGLNVLKLVTGTFSGIERAFAITLNTDNPEQGIIGLHEILPTAPGNLFDDGTERIQFRLESPALFYQPDPASRQLLRLNDGELIVKDISGEVRFDVYYRPDYDSNWHSWHSWNVPASPTWNPRMGLGQPDLKQGDNSTGRPYAVGYHFQLLIVITGSCTLMGANLFAVAQSETQYAKPLPRLTPLDLSTT